MSHEPMTHLSAEALSPTEETMAPVAWILCEDPHLCRFFAIELAHLGLETDPACTPDRTPVLVVADTDAHPVASLLGGLVPPDCPLLGFGYETADIPDGHGHFLRRPFPLARLETTLRQLAASVVRTAPPLGQGQEPQGVTSVDSPSDAATALDEETLTVTIGAFSVTLTPAEWEIFRLLYDRRGETVTREELAARLGGGGNSVEVYICHLRRRIEKPLGRRLIGTVRGRGYVWK